MIYNYFLVLWLIWTAYWIIAGTHSKRTTRTESVASRLTYIVFLVAGIVLVASQKLPGEFMQARFVSGSLILAWIGLMTTVVGLGLSVWARQTLGNNWSGFVTLKQDHSLITTGPYRWVRHPIYTGILLAVMGGVLATGYWRALIGLILVFFSFVRKSNIEEQFLSSHFGEAYQVYKQKTFKIIPLVY